MIDDTALRGVRTETDVTNARVIDVNIVFIIPSHAQDRQL
jgi:hypothetical protein